MFTRNGNKIFAPQEWRDKLPTIALDGELWSSRDNFQSIVSTVRKNEPEPDKWKEIKFMIFDAPLV
jgi:DNA ligase-1